jgi:hypothetical protein
MERTQFLVDLIKDCKVGAEVGVLRGDLSKEILSVWGGKLFLIDAWRHMEGLVDFNNPDHNGHLDNMAHAFMNVYSFNERAVIIRDVSVSASLLFQDECLDFVYIDAGHDKKSVHADLIAWYPKIKKGGLLIGDDYFNGSFKLENSDNTTLIEVKDAVDDFAQTINKNVNSCSTTHELLGGTAEESFVKQWWIVK